MRSSTHPQLVGALGEWLEVRPAPATAEEAAIVSNLILHCSLLGVALDDLDAPELDQLTASETVLVNRIRRWAVLEAEQRTRTEERARKESASLAATALAEAERIAGRPDQSGNDNDNDSGARAPAAAVLPQPSAPAESIWLGVTAAERTEQEEQLEQTRRRASRQEILWWSVCLIAVAILVVQLVR